MRILPYTISLLCLLALLAPVAVAGEEAGAEAAAAKREIWSYEKGAERRELVVTTLSKQLRQAIDAQLRQAGWTRVAGGPTAAAKVPPAAPAPKAEPLSPDTKIDIAEVVKRGGRLPEGFVPHSMGPGGPTPAGEDSGAGPFGAGLLGGGATPQMTGALTKATGKLLLRYLEVKGDPVKGPIYEEILRTVATALVDDKGANMQQLGMRMMGSFMAGMRDPKKGPVYREIMSIFSQAMAAGVRAPRERGAAAPEPVFQPVPTPHTARAHVDGPFGGAPARIGGALLAYAVSVTGAPEGATTWAVTLVQVPPESTAAAAGLVSGDRIEAIDGKPPTPALLKRAQQVFVKGGQLNLHLRRKDGSVEELEFDVSLDD